MYTNTDIQIMYKFIIKCIYTGCPKNMYPIPNDNKIYAIQRINFADITK